MDDHLRQIAPPAELLEQLVIVLAPVRREDEASDAAPLEPIPGDNGGHFVTGLFQPFRDAISDTKLVNEQQPPFRRPGELISVDGGKRRRGSP